MPNLMNIANAEAQDAIVTFGRDMSVAESTTMTITENGTYDVRKKATVIVEVEGNPNHKEVRTGKSNVLDMSAQEVSDLANGNISAFISIDISPLQMGVDVLNAWLSSFGLFIDLNGGAINSSVALANIINIVWDGDNGACTKAEALTGGNVMDLSAYMSMLDYTLTVYHHPMPEEP